MVEHLTLNQGVVGSRPTWVTMWPVGQAVKTPPFHGGIGGSIPPPVTIWALSSAGRASALQAECQRFDPVSAHHFSIKYGPVVQLVRMPPCHGGGRGFESHPGRQCGNSSVVEHLLAKEGVASSNLVFRSMNCQPGSLLPGFLNLFRKE